MRSYLHIPKVWIVLAATAAMSLAIAAGGFAKSPTQVASTITINLHLPPPTSVFGHVRSDKRWCKSNRTVVLLNETAGKVLAHPRTNSDGRWHEKLAGLLKRVAAKRRLTDLSARVLPKRSPKIACGRARSGTVPAP